MFFSYTYKPPECLSLLNCVCYLVWKGGIVCYQLNDINSNMVRQEGTLRVLDISQRLKVSDMTVYRDIKPLIE